MKSLVMFCLLLVSLCITNLAHAEFYRLVNVRRVDSNLYSFRSGTVEGIVQTKYCYEFALFEDAILKYDRYSYDNKIIFSNGTSCDVAGLFTK